MHLLIKRDTLTITSNNNNRQNSPCLPIKTTVHHTHAVYWCFWYIVGEKRNMQNIKTTVVIQKHHIVTYYLFISHNKLMTETYHNCTCTHYRYTSCSQNAFKITTWGLLWNGITPTWHYSEMASELNCYTESNYQVSSYTQHNSDIICHSTKGKDQNCQG